ncbi:hypothetical protein BKA69DRAFT_1056566, partial [Paraphysoderma sedebokerense]
MVEKIPVQDRSGGTRFVGSNYRKIYFEGCKSDAETDNMSDCQTIRVDSGIKIKSNALALYFNWCGSLCSYISEFFDGVNDCNSCTKCRQ